MKHALSYCCSLAFLALACGGDDKPAASPDPEAEKVEQSAEEAKDDAEKAAEDAKDTADKAAEDVKEGADKATDPNK